MNKRRSLPSALSYASYGLNAFSILNSLEGLNTLFVEKDYPTRLRAYSRKVTAYQKLMQRQTEIDARKTRQ